MDEIGERGVKRSADEALLDEVEGSPKRARLDFDPELTIERTSTKSIIIPITFEGSVSEKPGSSLQHGTPGEASEGRIPIPIESVSSDDENPKSKLQSKLSPVRKSLLHPVVIDLDDSIDEAVERSERRVEEKAPDYAHSPLKPDSLSDLRALSAQRYQAHKQREIVSESKPNTRSTGRLDDLDEAIRRSLVDRHPTNAEREAHEVEQSKVHTLASLQVDEKPTASTKPYSFRITKIESPNMDFDLFAAQQLKSDLKNIRNQLKPLGFVSRLNFTMTVEKARSLFGKNWLSDETLNTYISVVVERSRGNNFAYVESYWSSQILKHGPNGVTKWHQTADLLRRLQTGDVEYVFAPVNFDDSHWCLCLLAPRKKTWYILDSAGHDEWMRSSEFAQIMQLWLDERAAGPWKLEIPIHQSNAHQDFKYDSYNCGVYVCLYAEWLCTGRSLEYVVNNRVGTAGISNYRDAILMALFRDIPLSLDYVE